MKNEDQIQPEIEIARIFDRGRTIRTIVVCATTVCGLAVITVGYIISRKPAWLELVAMILATLFAPSGVIFVLIKSRKKYIQKHHDRVVSLEKRIDAGRTSSVDGKGAERSKEK